MSKSNQFFNNYGASLRPKSYFREPQLASNLSGIMQMQSYQHPPSNIFRTHQYPVNLTPSDKGICDGMNNCHVTEPWINYINHHINLPLSHASRQTPIINPYLPISTALELQAIPNNFYHQFASQQHQHQHQNLFHHKSYMESIYAGPDRAKYLTSKHNDQPLIMPPIEPISGRAAAAAAVTQHHNHNQQQHYRLSQPEVLRDEFKAHHRHSHRFDNVELKKSENLYGNLCQSHDDKEQQQQLCDGNVDEPDIHLRIKTSIKYQDRNKKLDFKTNFRDENRKVNGCFYDSDHTMLESGECALFKIAAPPKKKWIKHYLTAKSGRFFFMDGSNKF
jgi:hypothetical protein